MRAASFYARHLRLGRRSVVVDAMRWCSATMAGAGRCPFFELGLPKSSTKAQVKAKYKELAKQHHPDSGGDEATFKRINEAYHQCLDQIEADYFAAAAAGATSGGNARSSRTEYTGAEDANFSNPFQETPYQTRQRLCDMFETAKGPLEIDRLLRYCLRSHAFDATDIGEPLLRALNAYHIGGNMPLGMDHVNRCFEAIEMWEDWHCKKAPQTYYHPLLVVYSDAAQFGRGASAQDVCEGTNAIMERIESKGFQPDDWSISLATKVFRTSPSAEW